MSGKIVIPIGPPFQCGDRVTETFLPHHTGRRGTVVSVGRPQRGGQLFRVVGLFAITVEWDDETKETGIPAEDLAHIPIVDWLAELAGPSGG